MTLDCAVTFPGQGSQRPGMALDFIEEIPESREVFAEANSVLPFNVEELCRPADPGSEYGDPRLEQTEYAQPCILTAEIAMLRGLQARFGFQPRWFGGHSLGEYTALVAAGVVPFKTAVRLVHARGQAMQKAAPLGFGAMTALIREGLPLDEIKELARQLGVDLANDNSPNQAVVSGPREAIEELSAELASRHEEDLRIVPLAVSAPFHSRYMAEAEADFKEVLQEASREFRPEHAVCVTSNYTGRFHTGKLEDLIESLTRQVASPVRWRDNMASLASVTSNLFEVGPGRPLGNFFKAAGLKVPSIVDLRSARRALEASPAVANA